MRRIVPNTIVSTDTLNPSHLIPVFAQFISQYSDGKLGEIQNGYFSLEEGRIQIPSQDQILADLWEAMDELAADNGLAFGSSEGDGACIGFWLESDESIAYQLREYDDDDLAIVYHQSEAVQPLLAMVVENHHQVDSLCMEIRSWSPKWGEAIAQTVERCYAFHRSRS